MGIIKAATTVGNNISTTGTITGNGANTLYGATSIGGALTATSTLSVIGLTTIGNASSTVLSVSGTQYIGGANGLVLADGSITDATGAISFGNDNLTTSGTLDVTGLTTLGNASTTGEAIFTGWVAIDGSINATDNNGATGDCATNWSYECMGLLEVWNRHNSTTGGYGYTNTFFSGLPLTATSGTWNTATNGYFQTAFNASTGSETINGQVANINGILNFNGAAAYTGIDNIDNLYLHFGNPPANTAQINADNLTGIRLFGGGDGTGSGVFNITNYYGIYLDNMDNLSTGGTIATATGLWIDKHTVGATNNYGIVLDGNGAGADIVFGAGQEAKLSYDGSNLVLNSSAIQTASTSATSGTKDVCAMWATIVNPYACIGQAPAGTTTDYTNGYVFTYNNTSVNEVDVKSEVWKLNGAGDNEYLSRADPGDTSFSFTSGGFSLGMWAEIIDTTDATRGLFSKYSSAGTREWRAVMFNTEKIQFALSDSSAQVNCGQIVSTSLTAGWHWLVFTYDGTTGANANDTMKIYNNGLEMAYDANEPCTDFNAMINTSAPVEIGSGAQGGSIPLKSDIGHTIIGAGAWTADQVLKMYNSSKVKYGL